MDTFDHDRASELLTLAAATEAVAVGSHSQLLELIVQTAGTHAELVSQDGLYRRLWQQAQPASDGSAAGLEQLHEVPYFRSLDTVLLTAIAERLTRTERSAGETFFRAGDAGDAFYLIVRGQVDVLTPGPTGDEIRVAVLREGDYFGEMALIEDIPRTATVRAASPTTTLVIDRAQFLALLNSLPRLQSAFEAIIQTRRAAERTLLASAGDSQTKAAPT